MRSSDLLVRPLCVRRQRESGVAIGASTGESTQVAHALRQGALRKRQGGSEAPESGGVIGDFLRRDPPVKRARGMIFRLMLGRRSSARGGSGRLGGFWAWWRLGMQRRGATGSRAHGEWAMAWTPGMVKQGARALNSLRQGQRCQCRLLHQVA